MFRTASSGKFLLGCITYIAQDGYWLFLQTEQHGQSLCFYVSLGHFIPL